MEKSLFTRLQYCFLSGFPGVQIGSHVNDWNLDAPELQQIFEVSFTIQMSLNLSDIII